MSLFLPIPGLVFLTIPGSGGIWFPWRWQKFFYILGSRLAFGQRLFQDGSQGALRDLEEEWLELERRAQSLQQQALEQRVTLQKRLQVKWISLVIKVYLSPSRHFCSWRKTVFTFVEGVYILVCV